MSSGSARPAEGRLLWAHAHMVSETARDLTRRVFATTGEPAAAYIRRSRLERARLQASPPRRPGVAELAARWQLGSGSAIGHASSAPSSLAAQWSGAGALGGAGEDGGQVAAAADAELAEDGLEVVAGGVGGDEQRGCDVFAG